MKIEDIDNLREGDVVIANRDHEQGGSKIVKGQRFIVADAVRQTLKNGAKSEFVKTRDESGSVQIFMGIQGVSLIDKEHDKTL